MTTVRRVLQRVVLPADRDIDVLPLYVDRDKAQLEPEALPGGKDAEVSRALLLQPTSTGESLHPDAILDRHRLTVQAGQRVSFGTYFNGFAASYWRMWTVVQEVTLNVTVTGLGASVIVYRSMANGRSQRVESASVDESGSGSFSFDLTLKPFGDGGWYWFDVVAGDEDVTLQEATWVAEVPEERADSGTVTIGITTITGPTTAPSCSPSSARTRTSTPCSTSSWSSSRAPRRSSTTRASPRPRPRWGTSFA
jgi:galactofuranosylgalactofuranosylrhamnosyl-N-acetylglucosaminyl-diphospho-decaprenol beta-1,5/1,6-galactofuranosyltransferase